MTPDLSYLPGSSRPWPNSLQRWAEVLLLAVCYFVLARIGQVLAIPPGNVTPVWLPSGIIFFALLWRGYYLWPGIFLGAFIGNVWAYIDFSDLDIVQRSLISGTCNGIGDVICGLFGAVMVRRQMMKTVGYLSTRLAIAFLLAAALIGPLTSAVFGVGGLLWAGFIDAASAKMTLITWFTGDAVGVLVFASLLMAWWIPKDLLLVITRPAKAEFVGFGILFCLMLTISLVFAFRNYTFETGLPLMALLPMMGWSVLRLGVRWSFSMAAIVATASILVFFYLKEFTQLLQGDSNYQLLVMQSFVAVLMIATMLLSAITYQWADTFMAMKREKSRAENASRFKSNFLASISHELRTPMNGVIGFIDLLNGTNLTAVQGSYVRGVEQSSRHMMALIEELLDLSKAESGEVDIVKGRYSPRRLAEDLIRMFKPQADKVALPVNEDVAKEVPEWLYGDEKRIRQILLNFLSNALKFTTSGEIRLQIYTVKNNRIRFSVKDSGIGISELDQQMVFEPFRQAQHNQDYHGGTGLGLHICKRLVESMEGEIGVVSKSDSGSIFWFDLPLLVATEETGEGQQAQAGEEFKALDLHVLVADDNQVNLKVVTTMLKRLECSFVCAENGNQVLEIAKENKFDVILLDCMMPEMDGYQAAEFLSREPNINSHTPLVALTANVIEDNKEKCLRAGMTDFLSKPITLKSLYAALIRNSGK